MEEEYSSRGIELVKVASGYRIQVKATMQPWISRLWVEKPGRYSRAFLETLAIIAYRQPVTRGEIEEIRGVSVSSSITKTLIERGWVRVVGHRDVPGKPAMFGTTRDFLDYFNLKRLDDLPSLMELRDLSEINPELDLPLEGEQIVIPSGNEEEVMERETQQVFSHDKDHAKQDIETNQVDNNQTELESSEDEMPDE